MAFKTEKKEDKKFMFPSASISFFIKEMVRLGFDFDKFLIEKGAIGGKAPSYSVLSYENKDKYLAKYVNRTPYYSFDVIMLDWAWNTPFCFWSELKEQAISELNKEWWKIILLEDAATGKTYNERAREMMRKMTGILKPLPKYELKEYGNPDYM